MALNIKEMKIYSIDYSILEDYFTALPILSDVQLQKQYIKFWLRTLKSAENLTDSEVNTPEKLLKYAVLLETHNEQLQFQQKFIISEQEILLHFRISYLNMVIDTESQILEQSSKINLEEFTKPTSEFLWTFENVDSKHPTNKRPIIVVPFNNGPQKFIVIDGNHRISTAISKQLSSIDALFLSEGSVVDMEIPSSKFDMLFYIFINEINHIVTKRALENISDLDLLNLSFLKDGKYKFDA